MKAHKSLGAMKKSLEIIERTEILGGNEDIEPTQIFTPDDEGEKTVELNNDDDDMDDA